MHYLTFFNNLVSRLLFLLDAGRIKESFYNWFERGHGRRKACLPLAKGSFSTVPGQNCGTISKYSFTVTCFFVCGSLPPCSFPNTGAYLAKQFKSTTPQKDGIQDSNHSSTRNAQFLFISLYIFAIKKQITLIWLVLLFAREETTKLDCGTVVQKVRKDHQSVLE